MKMLLALKVIFVIFMELEASFYKADGNKLGWSLSYKLFCMNEDYRCRLMFLSMKTLLNYLLNWDAILIFERNMKILCFEAQTQSYFAVALHVM
jgi:hypothetical protein